MAEDFYRRFDSLGNIDELRLRIFKARKGLQVQNNVAHTARAFMAIRERLRYIVDQIIVLDPRLELGRLLGDLLREARGFVIKPQQLAQVAVRVAQQNGVAVNEAD